MAQPIDQLSVYLHLVQAAQKKKQLPDRDRLLTLAAVCAAENQMHAIAGYCRHLVLENNHGHMLRRWPSVATAIEDEDFQTFLKQVRRRFPPERAESMLTKMGIDRARERETYYSEGEYAAALLGVDLDWLQENYGS